MENNMDDDNINQLKEKIKKLEQKNRELEQIIYKAPIPIFVVDKNHKITHFNQALEELSGQSRKDMIGTKKQWKAFYKSSRPVMADLIIDRSSDVQIVEHYGLKFDRSARSRDRFAATDFFPELDRDGKWLYFTAATYRDSQGDIAGAVETLEDVTEEKIAERKTLELYRMYRKILEFVPYPIVVYDRNGLVSYINPSFSNSFGWSLEELMGKPIPFVPQELAAETDDMLHRFQEKKALQRYETQRLTKEGKLLDVVIWASSHSRKEAEETENFVILRDITEEKRLAANNKTIMRISAVLPEYPELEDLMTYISKEVKALLNTEGALILLYDEIKEELFFTGGAYDDSDTDRRAKTFRFPADAILAGEIIKTGEYAMVNDAEKLVSDYPQRDNLLGYKTKSLLEVPIITEDRIIGVLCAINKKRNKFDYNDMELMTMIAGTCAISIENARFSQAVRDAYRDVASMNRAKGKAINHLSHELKTPVAVLTGSLQILKKRLESATGINVNATLNRIERNLDRIVDIQSEVADIMDDKTYAAQKLLANLFDACRDELEILIQQNLDAGDVDQAVRAMIDDKFGPRVLNYKPMDLADTFQTLYGALKPEFKFRKLEITVTISPQLPTTLLPEEILEKIMAGVVKNAIENTPDNGRIDVTIKHKDSGILFCVHDFGVGIEQDAQKRIFEGFFATQETLAYSTKTPFAFNAGGKGADLLRMKIFSDRHGFTLKMISQRCRFLHENNDAECPGDVTKCKFCQNQKDCLNSGHTIFKIFFPSEKK
ncbi:MAG: PAS domain S-box protein [Desulfobacula sp.]|nr:PAS domain S-box protein [Desulfobacula sp.]